MFLHLFQALFPPIFSNMAHCIYGAMRCDEILTRSWLRVAQVSCAILYTPRHIESWKKVCSNIMRSWGKTTPFHHQQADAILWPLLNVSQRKCSQGWKFGRRWRVGAEFYRVLRKVKERCIVTYRIVYSAWGSRASLSMRGAAIMTLTRLCAIFCGEIDITKGHPSIDRERVRVHDKDWGHDYYGTKKPSSST